MVSNKKNKLFIDTLKNKIYIDTNHDFTSQRFKAVNQQIDECFQKAMKECFTGDFTQITQPLLLSLYH